MVMVMVVVVMFQSSSFNAHQSSTVQGWVDRLTHTSPLRPVAGQRIDLHWHSVRDDVNASVVMWCRRVSVCRRKTGPLRPATPSRHQPDHDLTVVVHRTLELPRGQTHCRAMGDSLTTQQSSTRTLVNLGWCPLQWRIKGRRPNRRLPHHLHEGSLCRRRGPATCGSVTQSGRPLTACAVAFSLPPTVVHHPRPSPVLPLRCLTTLVCGGAISLKTESWAGVALIRHRHGPTATGRPPRPSRARRRRLSLDEPDCRCLLSHAHTETSDSTTSDHAPDLQPSVLSPDTQPSVAQLPGFTSVHSWTFKPTMAHPEQNLSLRPKAPEL